LAPGDAVRPGDADLEGRIVRPGRLTAALNYYPGEPRTDPSQEAAERGDAGS